MNKLCNELYKMDPTIIGYGDGTTSSKVETLKLITQGIGKEILVPSQR